MNIKECRQKYRSRALAAVTPVRAGNRLDALLRHRIADHRELCLGVRGEVVHPNHHRAFEPACNQQRFIPEVIRRAIWINREHATRRAIKRLNGCVERIAHMGMNARESVEVRACTHATSHRFIVGERLLDTQVKAPRRQIGRRIERHLVEARLPIGKTLAKFADHNQKLVAKGKLTLPVLAVGGDHSYGAHLAAEIGFAAANVRSAIINNSGHWIMEEQPDQAIALIVPFLQEKN